MNDRNLQEIAIALKRLELLKRQEAFDPIRLDSQPTTQQLEVLKDFGRIKQQWVRAGNQSGKSQTCARIVSWVLTDTHPYWKRPVHWAEEPLLILVAGRTGKQIEDSLLPKIRGYLEPGTYKEVRIGNIIQRLELTNGNRVVFQSLENPVTARERLQSYVAHLCWTDELPPTIDIVRELLIRVQARDGYFLASFTPTIINIEIQKYVDGLFEPAAKVYRFNMLDNPLYSDPNRREELVQRYGHLPAHIQDAIFRGDWLSADDQVYYFNWDTMVQVPPDYDPIRWRHLESVDPALKSALGLTVWAEHPSTSIWYCVLAEYIRGIQVPTDLVRAVQEKVKHYNIIRRIADPHEVWYIQTAASMGISYSGVYKKNDRKSELIKQLQEKLGGQARISPTCPDLISELQECRWSDKHDGRIVNASSYHLLDSSQYAVDNFPPRREGSIQLPTRDTWLLQQNKKRLEDIEKKKTALTRKLERKHERKAGKFYKSIKKRYGF